MVARVLGSPVNNAATNEAAKETVEGMEGSSGLKNAVVKRLAHKERNDDDDEEVSM